MVKFNPGSLKVDLKLVIQRLKLHQSKKTEFSKKARKEVADYLASGKIDRARIKVEQIIRDDYYVEALEIIENFCDAIISRIGLIVAKNDVEEGIMEYLCTLIWVTPRLEGDIPEFKNISNQLLYKYGKKFFDTARSNCLSLASAKVVDCLGLEPPSSALVEKYLKAIADTYNINYTMDIKDLESDMIKVQSELISSFHDSVRSLQDSSNSYNEHNKSANRFSSDELTNLNTHANKNPYGANIDTRVVSVPDYFFDWNPKSPINESKNPTSIFSHDLISEINENDIAKLQEVKNKENPLLLDIDDIVDPHLNMPSPPIKNYNPFESALDKDLKDLEERFRNF